MSEPTLEDEDRQALADAKWWRSVAHALGDDVRLRGFNYRFNASFLSADGSFDFPGAAAKKVLSTADCLATLKAENARLRECAAPLVARWQRFVSTGLSYEDAHRMLADGNAAWSEWRALAAALTPTPGGDDA